VLSALRDCLQIGEFETFLEIINDSEESKWHTVLGFLSFF